MSHPVAPLELGDEALVYAREELTTAGHEFDGPLARRLAGLTLGQPFVLLSGEASGRVYDFRRGGVDNGGSDRCLAAGISRWLAQGPVGTTRVLVLEDPFARRADVATGDEAFFFEERVYFAGRTGDAADRIEHVLGRLAGYPGVGVLSEVSADFTAACDLTDHALNSLASAAAAVLVRAWDDEAFVVAPVGDRLTSHDL